jgi:hypothetical protein
VISAPSLTPLPKSASSPTSPNGAVKLSTDGAADNDGEDRAETLKKQYKRLQELFPGVDPKKEPQVQPTGAAQKQQQQQQQQQQQPGGPSAPQKAQMAAQMHQQLAQMSQAQKMEFMQRKGMQMPQQPNAQQQQQLNRMRQQQQQQMQQQQPGWRPGQPGGPQQGQQRMGPGMQQGMGVQQGGMDMNAMGMGGSPGMQPGQGQ